MFTEYLSSSPTSRTISLKLKRLLLVLQVPSVYRLEKGCTSAPCEVGAVATRNAQEAAGRNLTASALSTCQLPLQFLPHTCMLLPLATCLITAPPTHRLTHPLSKHVPSIYFTSHRIQRTQDPAEEPNDTRRQSNMQTSRVLVVRGFRSAGQDSTVAWCSERLLGGQALKDEDLERPEE